MNSRAVALIGFACWCGIVTSASAQQAPHAAHGARFGGAFATTTGDTRHVEVVWSEQRRVRLFITDASGGPLPIDQLRDVQARAVAGDRESPFTFLEADYYFESRVPTMALPAVVAVWIKPSPGAMEERLTFSFNDYSPAIAGLDAAAPVEIPATLSGIVAALNDERRAAQTIVEREEFPELLGTEDRIRDLVLALEPYLEPLAAEARTKARSAMTTVVRTCWLLHTVMDYGAVPQREAVLKQLGEALDRLAAALPAAPQ